MSLAIIVPVEVRLVTLDQSIHTLDYIEGYFVLNTKVLTRKHI